MTDQQNRNVPTVETPEDAPLRRAGYKDLSLVSLVPKWSGGESAPPIQEFFYTIEGSAAIGYWTPADMKQVCALKLTDAARAFYIATPELKDPKTSWQDFKSRFLQRFRDVRSVQYHFGQLYMARQKKSETAQEFLDRCRLLARRTIPCDTDAALQQVYNQQAEQMLLSAFTKGLGGTAGRQVRFSSPATAEEALRIAVTVTQAEIQETRDGAFYANAEVADVTPAGRVREPAGQHVNARQSGSSTRTTRKPKRATQRHPQTNEAVINGQPDKTITCFECREYGHYARDCANRRQKQVDSNAAPNGENSASQTRANEQTPQAKQHAVQGRRTKKPDLN
jgi:hypothetical protein